MSEAQRTTTPGRPWHLWLIGIIGLLWNAMGVLSFMLTQMKVEAVMSRFPPQQRAYFESFPLWAVAFWAIGVFVWRFTLADTVINFIAWVVLSVCGVRIFFNFNPPAPNLDFQKHLDFNYQKE